MYRKKTLKEYSFKISRYTLTQSLIIIICSQSTQQVEINNYNL